MFVNKARQLILLPLRSFSTDFASSFKLRAASKLQLKEFYKYTHPDVFGNAPKDVS